MLKKHKFSAGNPYVQPPWNHVGRVFQAAARFCRSPGFGTGGGECAKSRWEENSFMMLTIYMWWNVCIYIYYNINHMPWYIYIYLYIHILYTINHIPWYIYIYVHIYNCIYIYVNYTIYIIYTMIYIYIYTMIFLLLPIPDPNTVWEDTANPPNQTPNTF
jgi:hypothetical protein